MFPFAGSTIYRRHKCRDCYNKEQRVKGLERYQRDGAKVAERQRTYRTLRSSGVPAHPNLTPEEYKAKASERSKAYQTKLRAEAFDAYGGAFCACCGEKTFRFLTLDHKDSNGATKRRESKRWGGYSYLAALRAAKYPPGYQVLCFNCNCGRQLNGGICPHAEAHQSG